MTKVIREVAEAEVKKWLEFKNIPEKKIEDNKDAVESLIDAVESGMMLIDPDTFIITHNLLIPVENSDGDVTIEKLTYVPRLKVYEVHNAQKGIKATDIHAMLLGYVSALTKQPKGIIGNLDTADYNLSQNISLFFM